MTTASELIQQLINKAETTNKTNNINQEEGGEEDEDEEYEYEEDDLNREDETTSIPTIALSLDRPLRIGECFVNIFDLLINSSSSTTITTRFSSMKNLRIFSIEPKINSSEVGSSVGLISDYFSLNSLNGELLLRNTLLETRLSQLFKIIQGTSVEFVNIRVDVDDKFFVWTSIINPNPQSNENNDDQDGSLDVTIELNLRYVLLKYKSTIRLAKIYNYDPTAEYFLELTSLNKSTTKDDDGHLVLSTNIQPVKKIHSLVSIDSESYIVLNSEKFLERNLVRFDFSVLKLTPLPLYSTTEDVLERVQSRINYKLVVTFDDNFDVMADFMGYHTRLDVEKQVDVSVTRVGDVLFDLNRTLLNGLAFSHHLAYELIGTSTDLPFGVDLLTGNLIITHPLASSSNYEFGLALTDKFHVRFAIHTYQVQAVSSSMSSSLAHERSGFSQIVRFRVAKYCPNNYFIGKSINFRF